MPARTVCVHDVIPRVTDPGYSRAATIGRVAAVRDC